MKIKAGIVGPSDYVQIICDIAKEYSDRLYPIPFGYQNAEEATNIVKQNQLLVDLWIFAGPALYPFVEKSGSKQPFFYLNLDGASLTKTLVEVGYKDSKSLNRMSIDLLKESDVYETYHDLGISYEDIHVHEYLHDTTLQDLLAFHQKLFKEGQVDICITCLYFVYEKLKLQGIPVYRVTPTRSNIRETLKTAIQKWETLHFKQSQIAAIFIKVENMDTNMNHHTISYDLHRLNLKVQDAVLNFSESIFGTFVPLGVGTFVIFSTRGSIKETGQQIGDLLEKLALISELPSNVGIGYGETALAAEENARLALNHAQNYDSFCAFLVDDRGIIEGPLKEQESISFGYRTENKEISEKLKQCGVTITTLNKILSVQKRTGNHSITASILAEWLKMTPRNARRILNGLVEQEIAEIIGEEAPTAKGRPRKIYRVNSELETTTE
ncbi:hypothetical protein [Peribacillus simplex]|uniref:hypothetical protein n=1 Tax=Peribacillus simplex TaxID=1478 RepID=UPI0024C18EC2|nr:hypothetical protein [Peribacillus simplex]WHY58454.1 hypothetical protein QNH43_09435 [Peribacillus simplex]